MPTMPLKCGSGLKDDAESLETMQDTAAVNIKPNSDMNWVFRTAQQNRITALRAVYLLPAFTLWCMGECGDNGAKITWVNGKLW